MEIENLVLTWSVSDDCYCLSRSDGRLHGCVFNKNTCCGTWCPAFEIHKYKDNYMFDNYPDYKDQIWIRLYCVDRDILNVAVKGEKNETKN